MLALCAPTGVDVGTREGRHAHAFASANPGSACKRVEFDPATGGVLDLDEKRRYTNATASSCPPPCSSASRAA